MWFKTKTSLVHVEGIVEVTIARVVDSDTGKQKLGIYAYRYRHPEAELRLLWSKPLKIYNRRIFLAYFPDNDEGERAAADCMVHIEKAIRSNETLCDLSGFGSVVNWGRRWTAFVRWPAETDPRYAGLNGHRDHFFCVKNAPALRPLFYPSHHRMSPAFALCPL